MRSVPVKERAGIISADFEDALCDTHRAARNIVILPAALGAETGAETGAEALAEAGPDVSSDKETIVIRADRAWEEASGEEILHFADDYRITSQAADYLF